MNTLLRTLFLITLALAAGACKSAGRTTEVSARSGEVLYSRVGMHFEANRGSYVMRSTNHVELPKYVPPGSRFTVSDIDRKAVTLQGDDNATYVITYVQNHSMMPMAEWIEKWFAASPVELPADLTAEERDAIGQGVCRDGMSRRAVFLAIGYPPKSLNPSDEDDTLTYEARRFVRRQVEFDDQGRVVRYGR
ncbi:MAG: hypothetical protein KDC98_04810 [Planctomycetes bacterium]|nr:hypothetical protein [Planctomycetota bacterium]